MVSFLMAMVMVLGSAEASSCPSGLPTSVPSVAVDMASLSCDFESGDLCA